MADGIKDSLGAELGEIEGDVLWVGMELGLADTEGSKLKLGAPEGWNEGTASELVISLYKI